MKHTTLPEIVLSIADGHVAFKAAEGWTAEFIGADFQQLVDDNLKIHCPLKDTKVKLSFKCIKGSEIVEKDCSLKLDGEYGAAGRKPNVVPEPAQWHAMGGMLKKLDSFSCDARLADAAEAFAKELYSVSGMKIVRAQQGMVVFKTDDRLAYLGEEGYEIVCTQNGITVSVCTEIGAVWAGKTICQLMLQGGFPCGIMRDYPQYSVRGFMLDVGRKPVSVQMLEKIVDAMAWYKLNDFHVHLNDNYIWLEDYAENGDESTYNAYQAFRLESDLKNSSGETASSKDYCYSKKEFRDFIASSAKKGVRITP